MLIKKIGKGLEAISDNKVPAKLDDAMRNMKSDCLAEFIKLISDDKSLLIFNTIFLASGDSSDILINQLKLLQSIAVQNNSPCKSWVSEKTKRQIFSHFIWYGNL